MGGGGGGRFPKKTKLAWTCVCKVELKGSLSPYVKRLIDLISFPPMERDGAVPKAVGTPFTQARGSNPEPSNKKQNIKIETRWISTGYFDHMPLLSRPCQLLFNRCLESLGMT